MFCPETPIISESIKNIIDMNLDFKQTDLISVSNIKIPNRFYNRMMTGIKTVDEFLHEGFLPGSTMTLTAGAGTGKTTFMVQLLEGLSKNNYNVAYCSGEENIYQLAMNCKRINCTSLKIANKTDVDEIAKLTKECDYIVVDSFQALTTKTKMNSLEKEKYALTTLVKAAQKNECCICFIMHLTKAGKLKGSTLVPHTVDANLNMIINEDDDSVRNIFFSKNRFGPTNSLNLAFGNKGFNMSSNLITDKSNKYVSRKNKKEDVKKFVAEQLDVPSINTLKAKFNISSTYASTALRELSKKGIVRKIGRGDSAKWIKIKNTINENN